ncbi:MAG: NUMOD4 motif-containing HNH endonuclease [Bacteroidota bacterium]|nr:NUMOD4 motif-containing HNH endonuclease [Bacteroidota bacterium]
MVKDYPGEQWKTITFDFEFTNDFRIEVSNFGRLRTFNKISDGNIVSGSMINGYRIIRLKLYSPRDEKIQTRLNYLQQQVFKLARKLKSLKENGESKQTITETSELLDSLKKSLSKKFQKDLKERTINYHSLIHRLVADYFLKKPKPEQTIVAHLDHDKLNNRANNLKWMTPEENYAHQQNSPYVIKEKQERRYRRKESSRATKLTVTKVMLLKKMLNEGKPMKQLVKQFKVTDTQIFRIKRGENWADIEAAK